MFGKMMAFYSKSLAFNYFILSQMSGADVWYICDLTCSHNIGRMMVTLYVVLPMANMIPLHTLHMCINGTVTEMPDVLAMVMGIQLLYINPTGS